MDIRDLIDLSVNETLPRTVMTTLSMVLALGSLLLLGGEVIRGFTAAMLLGIVIGTYWSMYVSSELLVCLGVGPHTFVRQDAGLSDGVTNARPTGNAESVAVRHGRGDQRTVLSPQSPTCWCTR